MANFKLKTIWSLNGRAPDSRDVFDKNSSGLKVGRIDIRASDMVNVEGYSKVEYRVHLSDGTMEVFENFSAVIGSWNGVDESKYGSGFMTVFLNRPTDDSLGMVQIDVYKEFVGADPEADPDAVDLHTVKQWSDGAHQSYINALAEADRAQQEASDTRALHSQCAQFARHAESWGTHSQSWGERSMSWGTRSETAAALSEAAAVRSEAAAVRSEAAAEGSFDPAPLNEKIADLESKLNAALARIDALEAPAE